MSLAIKQMRAENREFYNTFCGGIDNIQNQLSQMNNSLYSLHYTLEEINEKLSIVAWGVTQLNETMQNILQALLNPTETQSFEYLNRGIKALNKGFYKEAKEDFEKAIELNYQNFSAQTSLGLVYLYYLNDLDKAEEYFSNGYKYNFVDYAELEKENVNRDEVYSLLDSKEASGTYLGYTQLLKGDIEKAYQTFKLLNKQIPYSSVVTYWLVETSLRSGQDYTDTHRKLLRNAIESEPNTLVILKDTVAKEIDDEEIYRITYELFNKYSVVAKKMIETFFDNNIFPGYGHHRRIMTGSKTYSEISDWKFLEYRNYDEKILKLKEYYIDEVFIKLVNSFGLSYLIEFSKLKKYVDTNDSRYLLFSINNNIYLNIFNYINICLNDIWMIFDTIKKSGLMKHYRGYYYDNNNMLQEEYSDKIKENIGYKEGSITDVLLLGIGALGCSFLGFKILNSMFNLFFGIIGGGIGLIIGPFIIAPIIDYIEASIKRKKENPTNKYLDEFFNNYKDDYSKARRELFGFNHDLDFIKK